jgi:hypothetical protein
METWRKLSVTNGLKIFSTTPGVGGLIIAYRLTKFTSVNTSPRHCHELPKIHPLSYVYIYFVLKILQSVPFVQRGRPTFTPRNFRTMYCAAYGEGDESTGHDGGLVSRVSRRHGRRH